jgi:hypothetical protein
VAGTVVGVVGLGGIAVGSAFGVIAASRWSAAKNGHCTGTVCDPTGFALVGDAKGAATISTASLLPGAAAFIAGLVTFLTAPRTRRATTVGLSLSPAPLPGGAGFYLAGESR